MKKLNIKKLNIKKYPLVIIFGVAILVMFVLFLVLPENDFSEVENRTLQTMPSFSVSGLADGSFMSRFETYTTEQLPFRENLVKAKALIKQLSLSNENNGIVKGKDGYLFETAYGISDQYRKNCAAIEKFTSEMDRPLYIAIAPTAPAILSDFAPKGFRTIDQKKEIADLYAGISENENVVCVDLYDVMTDHLDEQMYYRTDHHWTSKAAYYAYCEIVDTISELTDKELGKPVESDSLEEHCVNDFYGTHYAKFKQAEVEPDTLTYYDIPIENFKRSDGEYDSLYDLNKLSVYDKYAVFLRGNDDLAVIDSNNSNDGRNLIIFKDSYANCLIPFLTYQYDTITVVDLRYYSDSVSELLDDDTTADIMLLYNFDFLNEDNHFYRLTS